MVVEEGIDNCTDIFISPPNLIEFQQSIDFLVHPSEHESFGLSVVEAMALGKVVIINNFESAHEIVENGYSGIVINNISPQDIADTVESLWINPSLYKNLSHNALAMVRRKFDFNDHCEAIITEYDAVITMPEPYSL